MIAYRLAEFGVERIENGCTTFIHEDARHPAWREFQVWKRLGHEPLEAPALPYAAGTREWKDLWIIGAGGYGREVYWMAGSASGCGADWRVAGFLNDIPDALDNYPELPRIQGDTSYRPRAEDVFACAIGDREGRKRVCAKFKARGAEFVNLIQKTASVSPTTVLGEGIIVEAFAGIGAYSRIGDFTTILSHALIAHADFAVCLHPGAGVDRRRGFYCKPRGDLAGCENRRAGDGGSGERGDQGCAGWGDDVWSSRDANPLNYGDPTNYRGRARFLPGADAVCGA
jgi:hypothetical protein